MHMHFILLNVFLKSLKDVHLKKRLMHSGFFYLVSLKILLNIPHLYLYIVNVCPGYVESGHSFLFIYYFPMCL